MSESIFTDQLPEVVNQSDATYTLGTLFKSDVDGQVIGVRVYMTGTVSSSLTPSGILYALNGDFINSHEFGTLTVDAWNDILFTTPSDILADTIYVVAVGPTDNYCATSGFFDGVSVVNGHLTAPKSEPGILNGRFHISGDATFPNESFNDGCYFVDVIFQVEGEEAPSYLKNSFFFAG